MAAIPINQQYLQVGPRQGVYCSPIRWSLTQFRDPAESYRFRERIDPSESSGFPSRSVRRQFYTTSNSRVSLPTAVLRSNSSTNVGSSTQPWPQGQADNKKNQDTCSSRSEGSKFSLTAQAIAIQPRPPQRSHPSAVVSKRSDHVTTEQVFPYPDPYKIRGDPAFSVRVAELTRLECDTIKYEEWKKRASASKGSTIHLPSNSLHVSRSMSAKSFRPSTLKGVSESVHKPSTSAAGKKQFSTAPLLSRKSSLPASLNSAAINSYSSGGHHSRSLSVESCRNGCSTPPTPTATSSRLSLSSGLQWTRREAHYETASGTVSKSSVLEEDLHCTAVQSKAASSSNLRTSSQCPITSIDVNENISPVEENTMAEGLLGSVLQMKSSTQNKDQQCKISYDPCVHDSLAERNPGLSSQVSTASFVDSIPEQINSDCSSDNKDQKINKASSAAPATNDDANTFCRKKSKKKGGKRTSKMRSHSTPRLEYTVHSSPSTCSLKSTKSTKSKTHVHRKVKK